MQDEGAGGVNWHDEEGGAVAVAARGGWGLAGVERATVGACMASQGGRRLPLPDRLGREGAKLDQDFWQRGPLCPSLEGAHGANYRVQGSQLRGQALRVRQSSSARGVPRHAVGCLDHALVWWGPGL